MEEQREHLTDGEDVVTTEQLTGRCAVNLDERNHLIVSQAVARSWRDTEFRQSLLSDPAAVLREHGMHIPEGVQVKALEDTADLTHAVLPAGDASHYQPQLQEWSRTLGQQGSHELRVVQNTDDVFHVPVRKAPEGFVANSLAGPLGMMTQVAMQDVIVSVAVTVVVVVVVTVS